MNTPLYPVPCPTCGAPAYKRCRSLTRNKITDTHASRIMANYVHQYEDDKPYNQEEDPR